MNPLLVKALIVGAISAVTFVAAKWLGDSDSKEEPENGSETDTVDGGNSGGGDSDSSERPRDLGVDGQGSVENGERSRIPETVLDVTPAGDSSNGRKPGDNRGGESDPAAGLHSVETVTPEAGEEFDVDSEESESADDESDHSGGGGDDAGDVRS